MDLSIQLLSHLRGLVESIGEGDGTLSESLAVLVQDVRSAVSSYLGLRLTVVLDGWPVTLAVFGDIDGQRPATSLRLALSDLDPVFDPQSRIVFYASRPGALVDLAADLDYLQRQRGPAVAGHAVVGRRDARRPTVRLDVDLPPVSLVSEISGLTEYVTINRAVGVLINEGHHPDYAHAALHRAAADNGLTPPDYAARLLGR